MKTPAKDPRPMMTKWAGSIKDRRVIEAFWEWMQANYSPDMRLGDAQDNKILDKYHGIDRRQLDDERRAMLEAVGKGGG